MGVRIVVVLQHDMAHEWAMNPNLGRFILSKLRENQEPEIEGCKVVEIIDDTIQTLLVADGYDVYCLAAKKSTQGQKLHLACSALLISAFHKIENFL